MSDKLAGQMQRRLNGKLRDDMKKVLVSVFVIGVLLMVSFLTVTAQDAKPLKEQILGTWECISVKLPEGFKQIKHVMPTHFIWIIYNRDNKRSLANAGGTWSAQNDSYTERIEFASESHKHLRGKEFIFTSKVNGDEWSHGNAGNDIVINEIWKRIK